MSIAAAVFQAEERLARAHEMMDLAIIAELLHPNYVMLQPNGQIENRQDVLDSYRSGERHWDMARVGDMTVRLAGETATVTGRWWAIGQNGAEYFDYAARFLSVWVQTDQGWRNIAYSSVEISEE
ncbi:MAG: nuclear transport factor 2 family protein [Caldilineaceae bacterium]|nr:nuclear transport factor 2 family protein [Caldilineaceae bacterium]MBP8108234.1 nuclear transport factor 2 family protein [Caldilineaceae bacterium]MBP8124107.1 nuclear transport factor 2 family protein [Caldilineaceae bacterium]MBP9070930.1 nuclear transport factor 2 family protein [Caldilineaceae bacterium]